MGNCHMWLTGVTYAFIKVLHEHLGAMVLWTAERFILILVYSQFRLISKCVFWYSITTHYQYMTLTYRKCKIQFDNVDIILYNVLKTLHKTKYIHTNLSGALFSFEISNEIKCKISLLDLSVVTMEAQWTVVVILSSNSWLVNSSMMLSFT